MPAQGGPARGGSGGGAEGSGPGKGQRGPGQGGSQRGPVQRGPGQPGGSGQPGSGAGPHPAQQDGFDEWLRCELGRLYGEALDEQVPEDMLRLLNEAARKG